GGRAYMGSRSRPSLGYSGFVVFTSHVLSAVTGLLFTMMVMRALSEADFGVWQNMSDLVFYFTVLENVVPFWAKRFVARGFEGSGRTGLLCSFIMGISVAALYGILAPFLMALMGVGGTYLLPYMLISIQVFEIYVLRGLGAVLHPNRPQAIGYAIMVKELTKLAVGFCLVFWSGLGLLGVVISVLSAHAAQVTFSFLMARGFLGGGLRWSYVREWAKGSFLPVYNFLGQRLPTLALLALFTYAGDVARGYYGAAQAVGLMIFYTSYMAYALYPRLLAETGGGGLGSGPEDVEKALKLVLMFAIPMTVGAMLIPDVILAGLFRPYAVAWPVLIFLAPFYALRSLTTVLGSVVSGTEKVDAKARVPVKELVRTRLFAYYSLFYATGSYLVVLSFILLPMAPTPLDAAISLAILSLGISATNLCAVYLLAKRCLDFSFPWSSVARYALAAGVMALVLAVLPHVRRLSYAIMLVGAGGATYLAVLLAIDREARELLGALFKILKRH
ncbi:hypothetical protein DRO33_06315, partial [Candidatus Bathyarchaeota archaeon]